MQTLSSNKPKIRRAQAISTSLVLHLMVLQQTFLESQLLKVPQPRGAMWLLARMQLNKWEPWAQLKEHSELVLYILRSHVITSNSSCFTLAVVESPRLQLITMALNFHPSKKIIWWWWNLVYPFRAPSRPNRLLLTAIWISKPLKSWTPRKLTESTVDQIWKQEDKCHSRRVNQVSKHQVIISGARQSCTNSNLQKASKKSVSRSRCKIGASETNKLKSFSVWSMNM